MTTADALHLIEDLIKAAHHPDIAAVSPYDGALPGLAITYQSGAQAYLWPAPGNVQTSPAPLPDELPAYKFRAQHALKLVVDLLDVAKPARFGAWRTVGIDGVGLSPCGVEIRTDGGTVVLRVTSGGAPAADSDPQDWPGYVIPGLA